MNKNIKKGNPWALLPIGVFLILFIGSGIIRNDFYEMPVLVAFMVAATVAILMNKEKSFNDKIEVFCKGAGNNNIITMCIIFLLAGAFSSVAREMGAVDATVNLSLSILPPYLLVGGLFVIACFISVSMGTSVGTITALTPIGIGISETTGLPIALVLGALVGGSMFGDNLSMISDTTIAAVRTQGCELKDKFRVNFLIVLPAAVITIIILTLSTLNYQMTLPGEYTYELIKVVPYLAVLGGALAGMNVFALLGGGVILAGGVGVLTGTMGVYDVIGAVSSGMMGMQELAMLSIVIGGTFELIRYNGGIDYILYFISKRINSKKGAELGVAALVSLVDLCTANNTIAIVVTGPVAKDISDEHGIDPRRTASILDIFSSCWQGIIPYGAQLLTAAGLAGISPFEIIKYLHYPILMAICGVIAILIGFPVLKDKKA